MLEPGWIAALYYANAGVWGAVLLAFAPIFVRAWGEGAVERRCFANAIMQGAAGHCMLALYWTEKNVAWAEGTASWIVAVYSIRFITSGLTHIRTATLGWSHENLIWKAVGGLAAAVAAIRYWCNG